MTGTTTTGPMRISQTQLAGALGVDRTSITRWQKQGLPYIATGRGQSAEYIPALAIMWRTGVSVAKRADLRPRPEGAVDPVALAHALDDPGERRSHDTIVAELKACGVGVTRRQFEARATYWRGVLDGHRQRHETGA